MPAVLIIATASVIVAFFAAVAYGGPKAFIAWSQHTILLKQQNDSTRLVGLHIEDHDKAAEAGTEILDPSKLIVTTNDPTPYL